MPRLSMNTNTAGQLFIVPDSLDRTYRYDVNGQVIPYPTLREIAKLGPVNLAINFIVSQISMIGWDVIWNGNPNVELDYKERIVDFIKREYQKIRYDLLWEGFRNALIYGWAGFEKIYEYSEDDNLFHIKRLKGLLHDFTWILADKEGKTMGLLQYGFPSPVHTIARLPIDDCFILTNEKYGDDLYGDPALMRVYPLWIEYMEIQSNLRKFFAREVGSRVEVRYPVGKTMFEGRLVKNEIIAKKICESVMQNAGYVLPVKVSSKNFTSDEGPVNYWEVKFVDPAGSGNVDIARQRLADLENLMIECLGIPVRAVREGEYGSRSAQDSFISSAITLLQSYDQRVTNQVNRHIINPLLEENFGYKDLVYIKTGKLGDNTRDKLWELGMQLFGSDDDIDLKALKQELGVPMKVAANDDGDGDEIAEERQDETEVRSRRDYNMPRRIIGDIVNYKRNVDARNIISKLLDDGQRVKIAKRLINNIL